MKQDKGHAHLDWPRWAGLIALTLCLGCTSAVRNATTDRTIRVMTFNIHHGEGLDGKVDLGRIASLIKGERADLVALQEVDRGVERTDRRDMPMALATLTGMACVFSNNFHYQGGQYGNAVLTRFPVLSATNSHYQMLRTNEQRGLLQVTVETFAHRIVFMNTHIDYRRDDAERLLNVREIQSLASQYSESPIVLCGDFNDTPDSRVHERLKETFHDTWELVARDKGWSYPAESPRKRIDYVWISKTANLEIVEARVLESVASDHRPVIVELRLK